MHITSRWTRAGGALAAAAATLALASVPAAQAAPVRTADTTGYTTTTYLQHALGLPTSDTTPAIEPVTYDRFQWLLQQPGRFAFLIGDPASTTDTTFAQRAQDIEAEAKSKGIKKVYWFNPNLSGRAVVGTITEPALDIRAPSSITLASASQAKYDNAWKTLVADYLGNGLAAAHTGVDSENATVRIDPSASTRNDVGGTRLAGGGSDALFDYTSSTPANILHSYFLVYDKDATSNGAPAKIVGWTDLTADDSAATTAAVDTAVTRVGSGTDFAELDQFAWWKDEVNAKHAEQTTLATDGADHPVLTDADDDGGWNVEQITYPELIDLLKSGANDKTAAILFGGTWCPNTRPVLPHINAEAKANGVHVFNYDTVLDGGLVGGSTTSAGDPLQTRNTTVNGGTANANPSYLYGDAVSRYLPNLKTQYDKNIRPSDGNVTYFPGGDTSSGTPTPIRKLQVPYLIGYQNSSVTRQWIIDNGDGSYTEYMSYWYATNPQPGELHIPVTTLPARAPIWDKINQQLSTITWQTDPATVNPNSGIDTDDAQYLVAADRANVTNSSGTWTVAYSATGAVDISPAALSAALTALGSSTPANLAAAKAALTAATAGSDSALTANLTTVVGAWGVASQRKGKVIQAWGDARTPGSVIGGAAALHAVDVFFGGLPGGVLSRRTLSADGNGITINIANDYGRNPAGNVALTLTKGGTTVTTASAAVSGGSASFTLPSSLDAGAYDYTLTYAGDDQILGFTESGSLTVQPKASTGDTGTTTTTASTPTTTTTTTTRPATTTTTTPPKATKASAGTVKVTLVTRPTSKKGGKYTVSIAPAKGRSAASGKVTIKLKKGSVTKTITAKLAKGKATFTLPKLAKGTWKVTITWPGDTTYKSLSKTATSIKVTK
jgi:thiol-disulfide isomerase/thioredoxin